MPYIARFCPRALWKDANRHTTAQNLTRTLKGFRGLNSVATLNKEMICLLTRLPHKRNLAQLFLHHPFEVLAKEAVKHPDVKHPLMVGNKDVRLPLLQMLPTLHLDGKEEYPATQARPDCWWVITPEVATPKRATDDGGDGGQHRGNQHQRYGDTNLIETIKESYYNFHDEKVY